MIRTLLGKELKIVWASPLPYVLGAVLYATFGALGWSQLVGRQQAVFQPLVPVAGFLIVLIAPVVTSRAVSEEIRTGTLELLLAIPVPRFRLVLAKFLAAFVTILALLVPSMLFVLLLVLYGSPDAGPIVSGYLGLVLLAGAVVAVGVLTSALTSSQPIAAIAALFSVLVLWFAHTGSESLTVGGFLGGLSFSERLRAFAGGVIELGDVVFFLSVVILALVGGAVAIESRRWR